MWTEKEISWMAGLFEGEGCVTINRHQKNDIPYVRVSLGMTDRDVIERLHETVKVGIFTERNIRPGLSKPMFYWTLGKRNEIHTFLSAILPEMGERRSLKIVEALDLIESQIEPINCLGCGIVCDYSQNRKYCTRNCGRRYQACLAQELDLAKSGI